MRHLLRAAGATLLIAALAGCAVTPEAPPPPMTISAIHEAPGRTKQQLCTAARDWAALTFRDSKAVVEVYDPEQGKMIGKGRVMLTSIGGYMPTEFTLLVECKDGRARTTYDGVQPYHQGQPFPLISNGVFTLREQADTKLRALDSSLAEYMKNPKVGTANDW